MSCNHISECPRCRDEVEALDEEIERLNEKLQRIYQWCEAYPVDIFPVPDWKAVRKALEDNNLSISQVSAANMRHVVDGIRRVIEEEKS